MRFALLCDDLLARPVIDVISDRIDGHQLTHAVRMTPQSDQLLHGRPNVTFVDHWEDLLVAKEIDAVIVGGSDARILEGAKQLASAGVSILFFTCAEQGSTFVYELSLIRDDNHVLLVPVFWHRYDAAVTRLRTAIASGELGRVQYLQIQRTISKSAAGMPISKSEVDTELLNDVDLPRWLIGDYNQVTALSTAATSDGVLLQSVVLAGRSLPECNWSINSVAGPPEWSMTIRAEHSVAVLHRTGSAQQWTCSIDGQQVDGDERDNASRLIAKFTEHASQHSRSTANAVATSIDDIERDWSELVKSFETVDATHRSIRRRRTIELHFEPMSERAIFKTQMTAIGCGLLVATFLLTLCYLGIASLVPLPSSVLIGLRTLVFAPLVIFLVAQVLLPLTRPSSNEQRLEAHG